MAHAGRVVANDVADFTGMTRLRTITVRSIVLVQRDLEDVTMALERFIVKESMLYHVHLDFVGSKKKSQPGATALQDVASLLQELERVLIDLHLRRVSYAFVDCPPLTDSFDSGHGSRSQDDLFPGLRESGAEVILQFVSTTY